MFTITQGKGFRIMFANGYGVSVQWGPGNYCSDYNGDITAFYTKRVNISKYMRESLTVETAIVTDKSIVGDVFGYQTPEEVAALIAKVSDPNFKPEEV